MKKALVGMVACLAVIASIGATAHAKQDRAHVKVAMAVKTASGQWIDGCTVSYSTNGRAWHALPNGLRGGTIAKIGQGYPKRLRGKRVNFMCYDRFSVPEGILVRFRINAPGYAELKVSEKIPTRAGNDHNYQYLREVTLSSK